MQETILFIKLLDSISSFDLFSLLFILFYYYYDYFSNSIHQTSILFIRAKLLEKMQDLGSRGGRVGNRGARLDI